MEPNFSTLKFIGTSGIDVMKLIQEAAAALKETRNKTKQECIGDFEGK